MPCGLGIWEILILAGVLVLLFGARGAPAMARRLGTGVREMKDAVSEMLRLPAEAGASGPAASPRCVSDLAAGPGGAPLGAALAARVEKLRSGDLHAGLLPLLVVAVEAGDAAHL